MLQNPEYECVYVLKIFQAVFINPAKTIMSEFDKPLVSLVLLQNLK